MGSLAPGTLRRLRQPWRRCKAHRLLLPLPRRANSKTRSAHEPLRISGGRAGHVPVNSPRCAEPSGGFGRRRPAASPLVPGSPKPGLLPPAASGSVPLPLPWSLVVSWLEPCSSSAKPKFAPLRAGRRGAPSPRQPSSPVPCLRASEGADAGESLAVQEHCPWGKRWSRCWEGWLYAQPALAQSCHGWSRLGCLVELTPALPRVVPRLWGILELPVLIRVAALR